MTRNHKPGVMRIGPLSPGGVGAHYVQPRLDWSTTPSTLICNASVPSTERYSAKTELSYRGMDQRHPSRGHGC
jgi:hypothetical protein